MDTYSVRFTDLAAVKGGDGLEHRVRQEVAQLLEDGLTSPLELIFHTFEYEDAEFICYPRDGAMEVDTCYREKMDTTTHKGPLAGKTLLMPRGDSGEGPV